MRFLRRFFERLANFAGRRRADQRLREEMEEHLALQTEENLRDGMPQAEARRQAVLKFGAVGTISEGYSMRVVMESRTAVYVLKCIYKTAGCIIPVPDQLYYLTTESTPLGKYDSAWLKDWYAECDKAPTIGIVPVSDWPDEKDFMKAYNAVGAHCLESMTVRK